MARLNALGSILFAGILAVLIFVGQLVESASWSGITDWKTYLISVVGGGAAQVFIKTVLPLLTKLAREQAGKDK